ncbi:hypothetical protein N836_31190 [Leptolyngbya sp. Heron Island J]|uniref:Imm7 family immunity protein n=1 Tax=Leptolyngbya sp. Heron Island J TaxID=1385935 RepID=UPI0003B973C4|nr:Imm7 family immunity protein [Leptolyngbya sp. Heron Island J]ESA38676.1 hypothetical protein N836_31190 [Leptolyngbya sp. Heron Island J]
MFEFHAWATIRINDDDDPRMDVLAEREDRAIERLQNVIDMNTDNFSHFDLRRTSNRLIVFLAHGLRNHAFLQINNIFQWIADNFPNSYGLLYTFDSDHDNHFVVQRLASGQLSEHHDQLLSPCIPTIEKPLEP